MLRVSCLASSSHPKLKGAQCSQLTEAHKLSYSIATSSYEHLLHAQAGSQPSVPKRKFLLGLGIQSSTHICLTRREGGDQGHLLGGMRKNFTTEDA